MYGNTRFEVILGPAGTGKSTLIRNRLTVFDAEGNVTKPGERLALTATTGVAAYNLGPEATTVNSFMRFFQADDLEAKMKRYWYPSFGYKALLPYDGIVIDEISMLKPKVLDLLTSIFIRVSEMRIKEGLKPLTVILTGDFCQIPPVDTPVQYAFQSAWWEHVWEPSIQHLTQIYRQKDPCFLDALTCARRGNGAEARQFLNLANVRNVPEPFYNFPGFSLYPTNASVEKHNRICLDALTSKGYTLTSRRWIEEGMHYPEDLKLVPESVPLKDGCRVRFTANETGLFVNGQLGTLQTCGFADSILRPVVLADGVNGSQPYEVTAEPMYRIAYRPVSDADTDIVNATYGMRWLDWQHELRQLLRKEIVPFYNPFKEQIAYAVVKFTPLALGYASTFHKAQGLQFDRLQIDVRQPFAGNPQMAYVALSRAKTPENLIIVGDISRRINTAQEVRKFI